jgi:hypothetical protein
MEDVGYLRELGTRGSRASFGAGWQGGSVDVRTNCLRSPRNEPLVGQSVPTGERGSRGCGGDQHIRCTFGRRCERSLISVMNRPAGDAPASVGRLDSSEPPGAAARAERPDIASRLSQPCMSLRPSNRVISIHGSSPQLLPGRHSAESARPPRMVLVKSVARRIFRLSSMIVAAPHARSAGCAAH